MEYDMIGTIQQFPETQVGMIRYVYKIKCNLDIWLPCEGQLLKIEDYPDLYNMVRFPYGEGKDGYFKLPDFRGGGIIPPLGGNVPIEQIYTITSSTVSSSPTIRIPSNSNWGDTIWYNNGYQSYSQIDLQKWL